jgi:lipopolysaccharide biosynthesis protein
MKLAVLLHMFDLTLLQEFHAYLDNIRKAGYKYDIYIALPPNTDPRTVKSYWSKAVVVYHENRGMDIGGFFALCPSLLRTRYDYVLKLHTKSHTVWRKALLEPLLGTPEKVEAGLALFTSKVGMIGAKSWLIRMGPDLGIYDTHISQICKTWNVPKTTCSFIGGTVFWVRYSILKSAISRINIPNILSTFNTENTLDWSWYVLHYDDIRLAGVDTEEKAIAHWRDHGKSENRSCNVLYGRKHGISIRVDGMIEHAYELFFGLLVTHSKQIVVGV